MKRWDALARYKAGRGESRRAQNIQAPPPTLTNWPVM